MNTKIAQPLWQHPTCVMMVDDDEAILEANANNIDQQFPYIAFTNPKDALAHLKKYILPLEILSQEIITDVESEDVRQLTTENVAIDFFPLRHHLDTSNRFNCCVIVVVDHKMIEMEGLEFCRIARQLGLPVKLILLTGKVGDKDIISAFNENIIDAFVKKSPDMMKEVNHHINRLLFEEFCDASSKLLGPVLNKFELLGKNEFAEFINEICQKFNVIEYYIIDSSCSYLLIASDGSMKVLCCKFPHDFRNAYEFATSEKMKSNGVVEALRKHTAFPFTGVVNSYYMSNVSQWDEMMLPMEHNEELGFYYGVRDIPSEEVVSFDSYMNEIWEPSIK